MKITPKLKAELLRKGFKEIKINGVLNYVNSIHNAGFEIKNNHFNYYEVVKGEKMFNQTDVCEQLADAMNIVMSMNEIAEVIAYIPETAIVPQNLTAALIAKHPGTIACLLSMQQTNPAEIQTVTDANGNPVIKNGKPVRYVTGDYMQRCLNYACLFNWDLDIIETREDEIDGKTHLSAWGKLTIRTTEGATISKNQWGSQILRSKQELGDALKGATTDSFKKCASALGIARDVYAGEV